MQRKTRMVFISKASEKGVYMAFDNKFRLRFLSEHKFERF